MRKISKMAVGTPLRNTSPAAIEDFLVSKVRSDLGDLTDIATIRPVVRVDTEDGDLSGNITNGFGTVMVTVKEKTLHLPFIISDKELLPFDSIEMGSDKVSYDLGKLRKLVIALDNHKEKEIGQGDVMEVVDIRDIPTHNGFLGTIMSVRDEHKSRDINGHQDYRGDSFGDMDERRISKSASTQIDVAEVFEEFHEKLAEVRFFSHEDVAKVTEGLGKKAETESQKAIDAIKQVTLETKEGEGVKREMARIDSTTLVDLKRSASGNNVRFPIFDENRFEFRNGRVYHNIKPLGFDGKTGSIKRIVLDANGQYAFLTDGEKFMLDTESPTMHFDMPTEKGRGIGVGEMYAVEVDKSSITIPFTIERSFREHYMDNGMLISVRERMKEGSDNPVNPLNNSIFRDAVRCSTAFGSQYNDFVILIVKNSDDEFKSIEGDQIKDYIATRAEHGTDSSNAQFMATYLGGAKYYVMGEDAKLFKFKKKMAGYFTRPDGMFKEGPLFHKEAAYDQSNKARLVINEQKKPAVYAVEWSFTADADVDGKSAYNMQKRELKDLAPAQAKKVLADLGFDARKQEMFFEIAKRNGRYAEFRLPDVKKAAQVSPKDAGLNKVKSALSNIANSTLNAKNFVPVMNNFSLDAVSGKDLTTDEDETSKSFKKKAETSYQVAAEFEKVAEQIRGKEWAEVAYLLNMKHHMDKVACQIGEGFVKNAEPLFKTAADLEGVIEKKAATLLDFNRQQLIYQATPLVSPQLIKQAMQQFDEMAGYVATKNELEKQASFFHKGVRNTIQSIEESIKYMTGDSEKLKTQLRNNVIYLRTLERKGEKDSPKFQKVMQESQELVEKSIGKAKETGALARQQTDLQSGMENKNRAALAGVGLPGIAGLSYGYQAFKDQG